MPLKHLYTYELWQFEVLCVIYCQHFQKTAPLEMAPYHACPPWSMVWVMVLWKPSLSPGGPLGLSRRKLLSDCFYQLSVSHLWVTHWSAGVSYKHYKNAFKLFVSLLVEENALGWAIEKVGQSISQLGKEYFCTNKLHRYIYIYITNKYLCRSVR